MPQSPRSSMDTRWRFVSSANGVPGRNPYEEVDWASLLLAVVGLGPMLAEVMLVALRLGDRLSVGVDRHRHPLHGGQFFQNDRDVRPIVHGFAPCERGVAVH